MRAIAIAAALFVAAPAFADAPATRATLVDTAKAPAGRLIVDGAAWRCEGNSCTATGGSAQPASRACRRVVARIGKVSAFAYKGTELTAEELAVCNAD
ncbi:CC_3452 family protein [Brevundimonas sp.]|uniref:CC_3452 family protein n=1 Tax=Brevundimonas sp. TaxID=1871086 RepID=UPI00289D7C63|nr:hypothetical protein [Brevundimonas sp.]